MNSTFFCFQHGENLQRKMTCNEFIENLSELNDGQNFPKDLLKGIYYSIKQEAIPWAPGKIQMPFGQINDKLGILFYSFNKTLKLKFPLLSTCGIHVK